MVPVCLDFAVLSYLPQRLFSQVVLKVSHSESQGMLLHFLLSSLDLEPPSYFASQVAQLVKNLPATRDLDFNPWVGKIPWGRAWQPTPVFLPGESPWTEVPGRLQSIGSQRVGHD